MTTAFNQGPIIGVTGGIGSGKSSVARMFGELGIQWVDADDVAREIVRPGETALAEIIVHFGESIVTAQGELDRAALRERIFAAPEERQWLERCTHPRIRERIVQHLAAMTSPYRLLVSPLLFESGQDSLVSRTLVVDVSQDVQLARTLSRDGVSEAQVRAILAAQLSRETRLAKADDVIDNNGNQASLREQVAALDVRYRSLAASNASFQELPDV
ncbi:MULTISPECIES: dephospho-CoA kinase [Cobetia]|uniref:dephospho-CoA kinase n=1 Tax=Cobetia TaxID=204286 RepID=UPI0008654ADA|nr:MULTISPECIES: dephospho-CoA kinase [Cobetia]AOM02109.1 dephospho-CoA kinase [Cobetia marina]AZV31944.1 dephospho-CoA kinase [Cobetia sp. ICG0124]